jgi:hypothetical protein
VPYAVSKERQYPLPLELQQLNDLWYLARREERRALECIANLILWSVLCLPA